MASFERYLAQALAFRWIPVARRACFQSVAHRLLCLIKTTQMNTACSILMPTCAKCIFSQSIRFSLLAVGLYSPCRLEGHAGWEARVLTAQVWAPTGLCGACSRLSKSALPPKKHGIASRLAALRGTMETGPHNLLFCSAAALTCLCISSRPTSSQSLYLVAPTVQQQSHINLL